MPHRWNNAASIRKDQIESGIDITFSDVFVPFFKEEILKYNPETIFEIGAGTGHLAKELALHCDKYHALEPSEGMFQVATETLYNQKVKIFKLKIEDFKPKESFDFVFSHLCAQTMDNLDILYIKMNELLNPKGKWMISVPHPCFYNEYKKIITEDYCYKIEQSVEFNLAITNDKQLIENVPYYHRPLEVYINKISKNGLILEEIREVFPTPDIQQKYGQIWTKPRYMVLIGKANK